MNTVVNPVFRDRLNVSYCRRAPLGGAGTIVEYLDFLKNKVFYAAE